MKSWSSAKAAFAEGFPITLFLILFRLDKLTVSIAIGPPDVGKVREQSRPVKMFEYLLKVWGNDLA
jgi:hypothetical protein